MKGIAVIGINGFNQVDVVGATRPESLKDVMKEIIKHDLTPMLVTTERARELFTEKIDIDAEMELADKATGAGD